MHRLLLPGLILLGHTSAFAFAQPADSTRSEWGFLPGAALLLPFPASPEEPRTGIRKEIGTSRMTLSIGGQLDLVEWRPGETPVCAYAPVPRSSCMPSPRTTRDSGCRWMRLTGISAGIGQPAAGPLLGLDPALPHNASQFARA